ncbi:MAG: bifunctional phosphoribosylaminoimidazolecarboxamide formyltransferase/IMP cyclohydrolase [Acidimicrobiales bacterium]|jgi:phosphoribosylaminoimidazolecarboxamide formyltransferase/IMP cyclohydrolase
MRALLSVYDKSGLEGFASGLNALGIELVASGGTARALVAAGIPHAEVAQVTGVPEMLGGRVKTLHPAIHAGILADRSLQSHLEDLAAQDITAIDIVACNLYPFESHPSVDAMDIGGPTMIRAAAKNCTHVTVVVHPSEYALVLEELKTDGGVSDFTRRRLARAAFAHTAAYDAAIVRWLDETRREDEEVDDPLPRSLHVVLEREGDLCYGENPHQRAARYQERGGPGGWWAGAVQHSGRELSYSNLLDAGAAWQLTHELVGPDGLSYAENLAAAVIVKHTNPCGVAVAGDLATAYERALAGDEVSAFGGIVALSGPVDEELAERILEGPLSDVLVAPCFDEGARARLAERRKNMRVLSAPLPATGQLSLRQASGGFLVEECDQFLAGPSSWQVVTKLTPSDEQWHDLELAWRICARTSSNAIVLTNEGQAVGIGCGQQNRVDAAAIAGRKAAGRAQGGAGASDAFFAFRDGLDAIVDCGVGAVVQPGGSLRDPEVIAAADERGIAMVVTGERHFKH